MNKRLIASMSCAALLLSATATYANSARMFTTVDVVSAATTAAPATPAKPAAKPVAKPATTKAPATTSTVVSGDVTRLLALGSVGNDVKLVQTWLNDNGYVLNIDGIYGKLTVDAVKGYQGKNALRADGIIGPKTLAKLTPVVVAEKPAEPAKPVTPVEPAKPAEPAKPVDVVTTASLVNKIEAFEKAMLSEKDGGTWIIAALNDLTSDKELVLEGKFTYKEKVQRKIALYTQDDNKVTTAKFTLTAPKLTIKSPNASIQKGTFKGDLYVTVPGFKLVDAIIDGNIYFTTEEAKNTFTMDTTSSVTGKQELQIAEVDVVATASIVNSEAAFEKAISKEGSWIAGALNDLTFDKELVLEGEFTNKDLPARKIALYTQDADKNVTARFTLTAPKLTINSPNARIQAGAFKGDIYVNVPNFQLVDTKVEGNIYFLNNDAKDTFKMDEKSTIKGQRVLIDVDATSTASIVRDEATFEKAIVKAEEGGTWIAALLKDLTFNKRLTLEGPFENRDVADRKIGLYSQKTLEDKTKVMTHNFTLTAPQLFIKSPAARMLNGTFNGNLYIFEDNFKLENTKVNGSVYFTTDSAKATFNNVNSEITGEEELVEVDAIASASVVNNEVELEKTISKHGVWITLLRDDITTDKELILEGEFRNGKFGTDGLHAFDRKLALYNYAEGSKEIGAQYTLTTPKLTIKTPKARIQEGTIVGDLYISAPGVRLINTKVEGNVYFTTQEAKDTFSPEGTFSISGVQELKIK